MVWSCPECVLIFWVQTPLRGHRWCFPSVLSTSRSLCSQDQLCGRDPTLTDELINILTELTQLSKTTNAKVALRARQVRDPCPDPYGLLPPGAHPFGKSVSPDVYFDHCANGESRLL